MKKYYRKYKENKKKLLIQKSRELGFDPSKLKSASRYLDEWAKRKKFKNYQEYLDFIALGRGFTCYDEYSKIWEYYPGMPDPSHENRKNPRFLGSYITEGGISKIFEGSQRMKRFHPGYDFICSKGYKIDVKSATLSDLNTFHFHILRNNIADYFILVGFNNIIELKPLHLWVVKSTDVIGACPIKFSNGVIVSNDSTWIEHLKKYERIDKLEELTKVCEEFNIRKGMEIISDKGLNKRYILEAIYHIRLQGKCEILPTDVENIADFIKEKDKPKQLAIIPEEECSR